MDNLKELNREEILNITGGHEGIAYQIGYAIGDIWQYLSDNHVGPGWLPWN